MSLLLILASRKQLRYYFIESHDLVKKDCFTKVSSSVINNEFCKGDFLIVKALLINQIKC